MNEEEKKAIEELEEFIKGPCETCKYCEAAYKLNRKNIIQLLNLTKKIQKENEKLKENNIEYERILDLADNRIYRKKYLEERRKEQPDLLYPDADEIYQRYYELKQENKELKESYIPNQEIEDKIRKNEEIIDNSNDGDLIRELCQENKIYEELLESRSN